MKKARRESEFMKKRPVAIIAVVVLAAGLVAVGCLLGSFFSHTICSEGTVMVVTSVAAALIVVLAAFFVIRYHSALLKKDAEIQYHDELFSTLSNNVDDIFVMLDGTTYAVDYISPNVERLIGLPESSVRGDISVLDKPAQDDEASSILDRLARLNTGEQTEWDREYVHKKTSEPRWFHTTALCREIHGEKKYILVLSDRTGDKIFNQELEDAVNMARRANLAKSTFLSNMSHDIRTPMNAVIGFATLALANPDDTDKVKDYLSKILSSSNHLLTLINDILDMSRIQSGKIQLEETETNLSDLLREIKSTIAEQIHAKQLELYISTRNVTNEDVYCDKKRIKQVLLNLLSNAVKFTPSGGTIFVRVTQIQNSPEGTGLYEIRVKDNGIGMSQEFAERIFEPFEREQTSTESKIQGTGLGMAISKNIIDMMGGTIEIHTEKDKGTEFVLKLSLRLQSKCQSLEKIRELEGLKALVVGVDFNTCDSVTKILEQLGMRSEWTMFGKEAVMLAKKSIETNDKFHAYIIDTQLPDMNGIEATRQILALGDRTPIIMLTAPDRNDIADEARAAGVNAFCTKPVLLSDLRGSILSALGKQFSGKEISVLDETELFNGKRLLLVEDNELNLEIAFELLKRYGFCVETAENGQIAVDKISNSQPDYYDLVLMDIQMPVMDGYEATKQIRRLNNPELAKIPIVAMTANAFDEDRRTALECGMNGFIVKPIIMDEVVRVLKSVFVKMM